MKPMPWVKVGEANEITSRTQKYTNNFIFFPEIRDGREANVNCYGPKEKRTRLISLDGSFELSSLVFPY